MRCLLQKLEAHRSCLTARFVQCLRLDVPFLNDALEQPFHSSIVTLDIMQRASMIQRGVWASCQTHMMNYPLVLVEHSKGVSVAELSLSILHIGALM